MNAIQSARAAVDSLRALAVSMPKLSCGEMSEECQRIIQLIKDAADRIPPVSDVTLAIGYVDQTCKAHTDYVITKEDGEPCFGHISGCYMALAEANLWLAVVYIVKSISTGVFGDDAK